MLKSTVVGTCTALWWEPTKQPSMSRLCACMHTALAPNWHSIAIVSLQETYNYFYLPFCKHKPNQEDEHAWGGLGEVLQGNELINSQLDIKFKGTPTAAPAAAPMQAVRAK